MSTWILVLTFMTPGNYFGNTHSIPGFKDRASCMTAGSAWLADLAKTSGNYKGLIPHALCVEQTK